MRKLLEKDIQKQILEYLALRRIVAWRQNSGAMKGKSATGKAWYVKFHTAPGCSDVLGVLPGGRFFAIEVKRPGNVATPNQESFIEKIRQAGGLAFVAYSVDDVIREFNGVMGDRW